MTDTDHAAHPDTGIAVPEVLPAVRADTSYEIPLDEHPPERPAAAVYVDLTAQPGELLPVIPAHLRTLAGVRRAAARHGRRHWHRAKFHGIRSPRYLTLMIAWAVAGVLRLGGRLVHWWWVIEQHGLRSQAAADGDSREWLRLHKEAKETRRVRGLILAGAVLATITAAACLVVFAPWWAWALALAIVVPLLARHGSASSTPTWSCAPTTRPGSATRTSRISRSSSAAGWPATATARRCWSTCRTAWG
jgi:DNA segregation ATPase FtsK/SpoIIIE, S-DNA-T family